MKGEPFVVNTGLLYPTIPLFSRPKAKIIPCKEVGELDTVVNDLFFLLDLEGV